MGGQVYVVGVGMTKFTAPNSNVHLNYEDLVEEAVTLALEDSKLSYSHIQLATVGYVFGDSTCGQRCLYKLGLTGIPIINVNNNCATGGTALQVTKSLVEAGLIDCGLAVGFDVMGKHLGDNKFPDRAQPLEKHVNQLSEQKGIVGAPILPQMFGRAGEEHMERYGTQPEHFVKIAWKNHSHSKHNVYAQDRNEYSMSQIRDSKQIFEFLTKLQCCPTSNGASAVVIASKEFVRKHCLQKQSVEILSMVMQTDIQSTFSEDSSMKLVGYDMTRLAASKAFQLANLRPENVDVIELHDCFSVNELITYEALGLCEPGKAKDLIDSGNNTYGGKYVINPSGGLLSKGHPLGATGVAQCTELCWQLRGLAGDRQAQNVTIGLQHNLGLGGAAVVALYKLGFSV